MIVEIEIAGKTLTERKRQVSMGTFTRRVDQPDRVEYKAYVKLLAQEAMKGMLPLEGPLIVCTYYYRIKPPSWPKKPAKSNLWPFWPWKKPDLDNLGKIIWDAVTGVIWLDDAQVISETNSKVFANAEKVVFSVFTLDERYRDEQTALVADQRIAVAEIPLQFTLEEGDTT